MTVIPTGAGAGAAVVKALKDNEIVCLLSDRDIERHGVDVEFFGNEHGQGGEHALADFATRCADDDAIVALDHDVAGEFHQILANEFDLGRGSGKRGFAKAHQQGTARGEASLDPTSRSGTVRSSSVPRMPSE